MSAEPGIAEPAVAEERTEQLHYFTVGGDELRDTARFVGTCDDTANYLSARSLRLSSGALVRQLGIAHGRGTEGYRRLDNEILAGLRLAQQSRPRNAGSPEVSSLVGYSKDPAEPYALLEPYRGTTIDGDVAGLLSPDDLHRFMVSLLTGLRRLSEAGIVHCALSPAAVRWHLDHVIITDFSLATLTGTVQQVRAPVWSAPKGLTGVMTEGVDILAAGMLIYYVTTGEELARRDDLDDRPELRDLLDGVFLGDPAQRPSAHELLTRRLGVRDSVAMRRRDDTELSLGRQEFQLARAVKHPELAGQLTSMTDDRIPPPGAAHAEPGPAAAQENASPSPQPRNRAGRRRRFGRSDG